MSLAKQKEGKGKGIQDCSRACSTVIRFLTDVQVPRGATSPASYTNVDGYRYINIFVKFNQESSDELPVNLFVSFAFDSNGTMRAGRYVNLEENLASQQQTNFIHISGVGSWLGSPANISSYVARLPVMGPFIQVYADNNAPTTRTVSIWGYLVS